MTIKPYSHAPKKANRYGAKGIQALTSEKSKYFRGHSVTRHFDTENVLNSIILRRHSHIS